MFQLSKLTFLIVLLFLFVGCDSEAQEQHERAQKPEPLNVQQLNDILKLKGTTQGGAYKIKIPQNDLHIKVDGFSIIPPMGATSWIAFIPAPEGARIMGDVVVKEEDVKQVEQELFKQGLYVTALHKHFEGESPRVMFMHIGGAASQVSLAMSVRAVLDKIESLRGGNPAKASSSPVRNTLDTEALATIIGHKGTTTDGVFKISIARPDIDLDMYSPEMAENGDHQEYGKERKEHEKIGGNEESEKEEASYVRVSAFTGFNSWAAFQGTPEKAAVTGDFAMLANEVPLVMKTLVENGFKVVSLHNHMIDEHPRIFFLHYWGTGNAQEMAKGLRKALDQTGTQK